MFVFDDIVLLVKNVEKWLILVFKVEINVFYWCVFWYKFFNNYIRFLWDLFGV